MSSSHKPRRRRAGETPETGTFTSPAKKREPIARASKPAFPLVSFLWPARSNTSQWIILPILLMIVGLFRWTTGFWGYSGFQSPPMHGDFEAQRHWMEITTRLPITQWYFHDLEWWGLDYPPLTAYHSWLIGKIGTLIDTEWFALYTSRRLDDPILKVFMRASVLISEYCIYVPAVVLFCRQYARLQHVTIWENSIALAAILMQPTLILTDHGHFQYNTVMLGFVVAFMACSMHRAYALSCLFFVAALGFKQMALYYAPAIFAYLLGSCVFPSIQPIRFISIALVTAASFVLLFLPLILAPLYEKYRSTYNPDLKPSPLMFALSIDPKTIYYPIVLQLTQVIHRVFPFHRGLFEDKVANFWCALHTFHKLHNYPKELMQRLSLLLTGASILPPCLAIFLHPQRTTIPLALAACAWGFFLFSFQVHEKSVLVPLMPMTLLLSGGLQAPTRSWVTWANILGSWTIYPLLKRDGLTIPYFVLTGLWAWLMGALGMALYPAAGKQETMAERLTRFLHLSFYAVMVFWHVLEAGLDPPYGKKDLWVVINVLIGSAGFAVCYLWCLWRLWLSLPMGGSGSAKGKLKTK